MTHVAQKNTNKIVYESRISVRKQIHTEHSMIKLSTKISKLCQRYKKVINIVQTSFNQYFLNSRFKATSNNFFISVDKTVNSVSEQLGVPSC